MAHEYIVAGRRALPGAGRSSPWSWTFTFEDPHSKDDQDDDDEAAAFEEGSFELDEIRRSDNEELYAFVTKHAGFSPKSVVTIRKAGWDVWAAARKPGAPRQ